LKLVVKNPKSIINPLLLRKSIRQDDFEYFKRALVEYKTELSIQLANKQSEPDMVTNVLKPFFSALNYLAQRLGQDGQSGIDLAIIKEHNPVVIIEAKKPNSDGMINELDVNKRSFHEAILYFMREREKGNNSIFHIVITDFYQFFIFDAQDFDRFFWQNKQIKKIYDTYTSPSLLGNKTKDFYDAIAREIQKQKIDLLDSERISCAYFSVKEDNSDKELISIYKLLTKDFLLKEFNPNDANSLNKEFYNELLYILGLEEVKIGGKKQITRAKNTQHGTFYENINNKLTQYKKPNDFETIINLIIIWVNRILFLKLLESQIVKWTDNPNNQFLHSSKVSQFDELEALFFEVLAKPVSERNTAEFNHIPYLNSSLFEIHKDEQLGITISNLMDGLKVEYYAKTAIKDNQSHQKTGKVSTLSYLLEFLDAFDFANDTNTEIVHDTKSLINASVLGLIFEKINGYKDGSFYTPSFITMYMAKETIEQTIINKFNALKNWHCKTLTDLYNKIEDKQEANAIINSITICDPAVGSGHFLVSALNEFLRIKSLLGILLDETGKRLKDYSISIENDELIIQNDDGELFEYKKSSTTKTRIQKTLFQEKQKIIENCLFGVDINPNSVNICRLRLWIELLKNAYYKPDGTLDTLPNIDINIKCGNSLISRFNLIDEIKMEGMNNEIITYKNHVKAYKENLDSKHALMQSIADIKKVFSETLMSCHRTTKELHSKLSEYIAKYGYTGLDKKLALTKELRHLAFDLELMGRHASFFDVIEPAQKKQIQLLEAALLAVKEVENGVIYQNAFEWRFEFPEVLNDEGDFIGFDIVIGNPPYGVDFDENSKKILIENYTSVEHQLEAYSLFIEKSASILRKKGLLSVIIPSTWLNQNHYLQLRKYMMNKFSFHSLFLFRFPVFLEATVESSIFTGCLDILDSNIIKYATIDNQDAFSENKFNLITQKEWKENIENGFNLTISSEHLKVVKLLEKNSVKLETIADVIVGIKPYQTGKGMPKQITEDVKNRIYDAKYKKDENYQQYIVGANITKYEVISDSEKWIKFGKNLAEPRESLNFNQKKIVIRQTSDRVIAAIDEKNLLNLNNVHNIVLNNTYSISYETLTLILNSSLIDIYYTYLVPEKGRVFAEVKGVNLRKLPIKIPNPKQDNDLKNGYLALLELKKQNNNDTTQLEQELDAMVYALYALTEDEINIIEAR
jgi:adenine-specific DNA-methyltransferase